jgi:hypothetical protein
MKWRKNVEIVVLREEREMGMIENSFKTVDENWADSSP